MLPNLFDRYPLRAVHNKHLNLRTELKFSATITLTMRSFASAERCPGRVKLPCLIFLNRLGTWSQEWAPRNHHYGLHSRHQKAVTRTAMHIVQLPTTRRQPEYEQWDVHAGIIR